MTKIQITRKNISRFAIVGAGVRGKGTEVFTSGVDVAYLRTYESDSAEERAEKITKFITKINEHDLSELYIEEAGLMSGVKLFSNKTANYLNREYDVGEYSTARYSLYSEVLEYLIKTNCNEVRHLSVSLKPTLMGYIAVSKYEMDEDGQRELLKDLLSLSGESVYGDITDCSCELEDNIKDTSNSSDYTLLHGENPPEDMDTYIDGRMDNHNTSVIDDFWSFELDEGEYLSELDPQEKICIVHRKGKDWYVDYSMVSDEVGFIFRDLTYDYDSEDYDEVSFHYYTYDADKETLEKVENYLKDTKKDLERRCYLYNELEYGEDMGANYDYNKNVFDLYLLRLIFEDMTDARNEIEEIYDHDLEPKEACEKANAQIIADNVIFGIDGKITIKTVPNTMVTEPAPSEEKKYNQLKIIKRLQRRMGYELVWSAVNPNANAKYHTYSYAIKILNEEYHFTIGELFEEDNENTIEFIQECIESLERRAITKKAENMLAENANKIFVGIDDSLGAGNCSVGTEDFIKRNQINLKITGGIRGDELLKMENSNFTRRAVVRAIVNHGNLAVA